MSATSGSLDSPKYSAASHIEQIASLNSSSIFVYDLAEHVEFGSQTKAWHSKGTIPSNVVSLQTRAGAGLSLIGRLSEEGTSREVHRDSVITAYNTPNGLAVMAPSFAYLPEATPQNRLVLQVPTISPVGRSLEFSPSLAGITAVLNSLPESFTVILSSAPQESIDIAAASYSITDSHVIHLFDHYSAGREIGNIHDNKPVTKHEGPVGIHKVLKEAGYEFFDFVGDANATEVLILLNGPLASVAKSLATKLPGFGVLIVRVLRPWDEGLLLAALPSSAKTIHVFDEVPTEGSQGNLYMDILATCLDSKSFRPTVRAERIVPSRTQEFVKSPSAFATFLSGLAPASPQISFAEETKQKKLLFFGTPTSALASLPRYIVDAFLANRSISTRSVIDYDLFSKPGGVSATRILLGPKMAAEAYLPIHVRLPLGGDNDKEPGAADFLAVLDQSLLKSHALVNHLKPGAILLVFSTWTAAEVHSNLPSSVASYIRERGITVYTVDSKAIADETTDPSVPITIGHLVFLRLYLGAAASEQTLKKLAHAIHGTTVGGQNIDKLNAKAWALLEQVFIPTEEDPSVDEVKVELKSFGFNAVNGDFSEVKASLPGAHLSTWHDAARHILFPDAFNPPIEHPADEAYPPIPSLRPELPERTYLVTTSVNRRLTPLEYDRNVFHLEFDTSGTGLKYAIGEALGVHGWNDADEVLDFCSWYGVDPDRLITIPVPGGEGKVHTRTVFQALQQQIDLFGKPPKSFYSDLSEHATKKEDKLSLQFIGSPEGSATFKKLSEKDTVNFADVLRKYTSARPSIEVLCEMVGDIKPRHYSIASAQSVVGDRVDLLVVTVEWATPSGSPRYGQCTRYLAGLKVGQKVTVSIKPSVMKLPPDNMQPLILAGLGTGAAPFRAFLQHRALLASQGVPVGPLYYYFGSRYRSKEYLYGEEIEAFMLDKTITKAGLAFSRDSRKKVYIQHLMTEDAEDLVRMLHTDNGVFYLCGPTWPVPDVYETLVGALVSKIGLEPTEAGDYLEGLKEEERYVLEVY